MKRKSVLFTSALAAALILSSCGKVNTENGKADIVIGTANGSLCLAPLHVALDNGYFEEEFSKAGVNWRTEEIDLGSIADLVASNKVDASVALAGSMIPQIDNGLEITFTAGMHTGCTKVYSKPDSFVKKAFTVFNGVPDSYVFNDDGTFTEADSKELLAEAAVSSRNLSLSLDTENIPSCCSVEKEK